MTFTQVKGNTWVLEGSALIPVYRLDERRCVLLDTGLPDEEQPLERALIENGLIPAGVLCSHAHVDHCANNKYLQKKYAIPVAMTLPEAGMCSHVLNLKCSCLVVSPETADEELSCMVHVPDVIIPNTDGPFSFCGATFQIVQTPGHSSAHIATITPDNVCYTGDALLSTELIASKLPYALSHKQAQQSRARLRSLNCDAYIMAHRGICPGNDFAALVDANCDLITQRAAEIAALATEPMTMSRLFEAICQRYFLLSKRPQRSLRFERNARFFIEYLCDCGTLQMETSNGVVRYFAAKP